MSLSTILVNLINIASLLTLLVILFPYLYHLIFPIMIFGPFLHNLPHQAISIILYLLTTPLESWYISSQTTSKDLPFLIPHKNHHRTFHYPKKFFAQTIISNLSKRHRAPFALIVALSNLSPILTPPKNDIEK